MDQEGRRAADEHFDKRHSPRGENHRAAQQHTLTVACADSLSVTTRALAMRSSQRVCTAGLASSTRVTERHGTSHSALKGSLRLTRSRGPSLAAPRPFLLRWLCARGLPGSWMTFSFFCPKIDRTAGQGRGCRGQTCFFSSTELCLPSVRHRMRSQRWSLTPSTWTPTRISATFA